MISDLLVLTSVQVSRRVQSSDGMGGLTTTTVLTTLPHAIIWQAGSANRYAADRYMHDSTHVLATLPEYYDWNDDDYQVVYAGDTYKITSRPENVMGEDEIMLVTLELLT